MKSTPDVTSIINILQKINYFAFLLAEKEGLSELCERYSTKKEGLSELCERYLQDSSNESCKVRHAQHAFKD